MSDYTPDRWVIVEMNSAEHGKIRKVLASWYGGYGGSDRWRLSSGITNIVEKPTHYEVHNKSGSIYTCIKGAKGMSGYTNGVYETYKKQVEELGATIEIVGINDGNV